MENRKKVANLIRNIREVNGFSHSEFAERVGIRENTLKRIEEAKFSFSAELLITFLEKVDCSILVKGKEIKL